MLTGAALAAAAAQHAWRLWYARTRYLDIDELEHLHAAWSVSRGLVPYRDFFEHHTPALYFAAAPFFAFFSVATRVRDAFLFIFAARGAMWALAGAALVLTFAIGRRWRDGRTAAVAVLALSSAMFFSNKTVEVRPDVPALALWLLALWLVLTALQAPPGHVARGRALRRLALGGACIGGALMFTQKLLFALPGLGLALAWEAAVAPASVARRQRVLGALAVAAGGAVPVLGVAAYFALNGALGDFVYYNFTYNAQLGRLLAPLHYVGELARGSPLLLALGLVGTGRALAAAARRRGARAGDALLGASAASLTLGTFANPAPYQQYFLPLLPLLALFAAAALVDAWDALAERARRTGRLVRHHRLVADFGLALTLAAATLHAAVQMRAASHPMWSNDAGLDEIRYVLEHTTPNETVLGGWRTGPGVFRPHAFFYFFLSSREAVAAVPPAARRQLLDDLRTGRVAPAVIAADDFVRLLSPGITGFIEANYEPAYKDFIWRRRPAPADRPAPAPAQPRP